MQYTRIHRLLKVIALVQRQHGMNAVALAEACDTSERSIYRDIQEMIGAGVPIEFDKASGGYSIRGDFFMPPVHLTVEESLALTALCEHISSPERIPFLKPASRALHKIQSQLPASIKKEIQERSLHLAIQTAPSMPPDGYIDVYTQVQRALAEQCVLRCRYEPAGSDSEPDGGTFELRPCCLYFGVRAWYVIGRRSDRDNELRSLKLNRFSKVELTDKRFEPDEDFSLQDYLGNAWHMIRDGDDIDVALRFDPAFATTISDTQWHRTQDVEWHEDDSCTFRCTVSGFAEIEWWILSMGPHCTVLHPPELAARIRDLAQATAAQYAT